MTDSAATFTPALGHIGLNVTDLDRSQRFYEATFGFTAMGGSTEGIHRFAFLGDGQRVLVTLWEQSAGAFDQQRAGLHHLALEVPDIADLERLEQTLRGREVPIFYEGIVPHAEGSGSAALYFADPDGLRLEVFSRNGGAGRNAVGGGAPACGFF